MSKLAEQLKEFHRAFEHHVNDGPPAIPPDAVVRLRGRLIIEEALEVLDALFGCPELIAGYKDALIDLCENAPIDVDMIAVTDGCADVDYVVEGTRTSFGINGDPIADEVHRSNMAKRGGGKDANGKSRKPTGWTPPDIAGELRKQGWRG